jgi:hypothetical protein
MNYYFRSSPEPQLSFKICPFNCTSNKSLSKTEPCVKKCCPFGMALDSSSGKLDCQPSPIEKEFWKGQFYDSKKWGTLLSSQELHPHYTHHILGQDRNCSKLETWFSKDVTLNDTKNQKDL